MKLLAISFAVAIIISACDKDTENPNCQDILIDVANANNLPADPFTIEDVKVEGDILTVETTYGGGCGDVEFVLVGSSSLLYSNPPQAVLTISFSDHDPCKALQKREICFDLSKLAEVLKDGNQNSSGTVNLRISGHEPLVPYSY